MNQRKRFLGSKVLESPALKLVRGESSPLDRGKGIAVAEPSERPSRLHLLHSSTSRPPLTSSLTGVGVHSILINITVEINFLNFLGERKTWIEGLIGHLEREELFAQSKTVLDDDIVHCTFWVISVIFISPFLLFSLLLRIS